MGRPWRRMVPLSLPLLLLLAGCTSPAQPVEPTGDGEAWTAWAGPYAEVGREYGFIPVGEDGYGPPGLPYVAVDRDGHVLVVEFQYKLHGDDAWSLSFERREDNAWRPILEPLFHDGAIYGDASDPSPVRVNAVHSRTLPASERGAVMDALEDAIGRAREPQPVGIADCGYAYVRTGGNVVGLNCGQGDPGWEDAIRQMENLRRWVTGETAP